MSKEQVPNFTDFIRDKFGEIWCLDNDTGEVCRVIPVSNKSVPKEVCMELLNIVNGKNVKE